MNLAFKQLRVYVRGALVLVVIAVVALILVQNRGNEVPFWFFWLRDPSRPVNVVWLIVCTAVATLIVRWTLVLGLRLWRDLRELQRLRAVEGVSKKLIDRAATLDERERRIDDKLHRAIAENDERVGDE